MAERYSVTVDCVIPLTYKCTKCGSISGAAIPLIENYSGAYSVFCGSKESQLETARYRAVSGLVERVSTIYSKEPLQCGRSIIGQCVKCRHREVWQTTPEKHASQSILGAIIGLLLLFACIVAAILLQQLILIPVFVIGLFFLLLAYIKISEKIANWRWVRALDKKRAAISSLPQENRPVYTLTLDEMLNKIK